MQNPRTLVFGLMLGMFILVPGPSFAQQADANSEQLQNGEQDRRGGARVRYQSEESETGIYVQPRAMESIPLEVERSRIRIAKLEDRVEKLEKALSIAIETINKQTAYIKQLSR